MNPVELMTLEAETVQAETPEGAEIVRKLTIESIADFLSVPPPPLDCIVEELFEAGDKGEIIAPSKARKSFFTIDLAAHIAAGRDFLCFKIPRPRRVLLFNLEIKPAWMKRRFYRRLAAYGIRPEEIRNTFHVVNARGKGQVVREQAVEAVRRAGAEVAIVDPRYKLLRPDEPENAGEGMAGVLDLQDAMAEAGAAAILVGHDGKGTAGDRDDRDRGAGSGWTGRDCDFRIVLSPHADDPQDALVLSLMRRNFPPFESVTLRHDGDSFQLDEGTAPRKETSFTRRQVAKTSAPLDTLRPVVLEVLRQAGKALPSGILLTKVREAAKIGEKRAVALIALCEEAGEIASTPRQAKRGGEVRRGTPEQVAEYMKPRLPLEAKP
ncbi:MAG TPA: AAA family ATPase [Kiritimatiellia bacterium]|nr:AAA family ATPase [Kiritimatiellia bacterium]HQG73749.1 AAA family ATPase [Kiritimatiellia bacterium]